MKNPYRDDKELVKRLLRGDESAFDEFFDHYYPGLYRFSLSRVGGDLGVAEDAAQAALSKAVSKLASYRGEAALFSWLCTFCRHEISAQLARRNRRPDSVVLAEDLPEVRAALESLSALESSGPLADLETKELKRWIQVTLDHLPRHYAQVLRWKYLKDLSVKEIAARLVIRPKAAESLLTRARQAFRDGFTSHQSLGWTQEEMS